MWSISVRKKAMQCALAVGCLSFAAKAHAEPVKEFVTSCSYGVLAGTLVGAATLAFTDQPGENLNKIARGASLGLYAGILLGIYVVNLSEGDYDSATQARLNGEPRGMLTVGNRLAVNVVPVMTAIDADGTSGGNRSAYVAERMAEDVSSDIGAGHRLGVGGAMLTLDWRFF